MEPAEVTSAYKRWAPVYDQTFSRITQRGRRKVEVDGLRHVVELRQMDARVLDFPDNHFDMVVAMYLVSVVPEPERVVEEMARVCKAGGEVIIVNHFARDLGSLAALEKSFAPFAGLLGWHSDFRIERVLGTSSLCLEERVPLSPAGLFTLLRLTKNSSDSR